MKILHTADVHLDSPLTGVAQGNVRRRELLKAFLEMAKYCDNNGIGAVIVAGDLFDDKFTMPITVETVAQIINNSAAQWYLLQGNHGNAEPYRMLEKLCSNVHLFGRQWTAYQLDGVCIVGRELGDNDAEYWRTFSPPANCYTVLTLHGDVANADYGLIDKKAIAASGVNYVALGHRHAFEVFKWGRTVACYSGVPEIRGFDETSSGFVVLDTDTDTYKFIPRYIRRVENVKVDLSSAQNQLDVERLVLDGVAGVNVDNYINLQLEGSVEEGLNVRQIAQERLDGKFFALRIDDNTGIRLDLQKIAKEVSLRGEFVKLAEEIQDERIKEEVLKMGFAALKGVL